MYDDSLKKLLIVEDDTGYRNPLMDYLSGHGYTVFTADDGEVAMERLLFHKPKIVVLDLMLPKVHGFEVLKRIRTYPEADVANMPVIVLSNLSAEKDIKTAQDLKIDAYLIKSQTTNEAVFNKIEEIVYKGKKAPAAEEIPNLSKPQ